MKLYHLLMNAEDCRVVLLTGTPIINYPNEVGVMMNILRGYIKTLEVKLNVLTNDKIDNKFLKNYSNVFHMLTIMTIKLIQVYYL